MLWQIIFSDKWLEVYNRDYVKAKLTLHTSTWKIANTPYIYVHNSFWLLSQSNTVFLSFYQQTVLLKPGKGKYTDFHFKIPRLKA